MDESLRPDTEEEAAVPADGGDHPGTGLTDG
jgi:hypothetical protein